MREPCDSPLQHRTKQLPYRWMQVAPKRNTSHHQGNLLASHLLRRGYVLYKNHPLTCIFLPCAQHPLPKDGAGRSAGSPGGTKPGGAWLHPLPASNPTTKPPLPTAKELALFPSFTMRKQHEGHLTRANAHSYYQVLLHLDNQRRHGDPADATHREMKGLPSYVGNSLR